MVEMTNILTLLFKTAKKYLVVRQSEKLKIRSSRPELFCKKGVLRNFARFKGKHLSQGLFFNKVATLAQVLSYEFCEISKNTFFLQSTSGGCF